MSYALIAYHVLTKLFYSYYPCSYHGRVHLSTFICGYCMRGAGYYIFDILKIQILWKQIFQMFEDPGSLETKI